MAGRKSSNAVVNTTAEEATKLRTFKCEKKPYLYFSSNNITAQFIKGIFKTDKNEVIAELLKYTHLIKEVE